MNWPRLIRENSLTIGYLLVIYNMLNYTDRIVIFTIFVYIILLKNKLVKINRENRLTIGYLLIVQYVKLY